MQLDEVVILSGVRTPIGKVSGRSDRFKRASSSGPSWSRKRCTAQILDPKQVDECIMGNVRIRPAWDRIRRDRRRSLADFRRKSVR